MSANPGVLMARSILQQSPIRTGHEGHFVTLHVLGEVCDLLPVLGLLAVADRPSVRPDVRFCIEIQKDRSQTVMPAFPIVYRRPQSEGALDELGRVEGAYSRPFS